jgi:hypothetical protein
LFAVTDEPRSEYGDNLVDLYLTLTPHLTDTFTRWTYNGAPPRAGSMVVDTESPGLRTWGWIGWRYHIPIWYAWNAVYWHDRHNHKSEPPRTLDARTDATSFDNGDDHGNLDGVLALPGDWKTANEPKPSADLHPKSATDSKPASAPCHSTLRLEALRRGLQDRVLLDLAATCNATEASNLAAKLVSRALGDASTTAAWPSDEATWEAARRHLLELADCN